MQFTNGDLIGFINLKTRKPEQMYSVCNSLQI